MEGEGGRGDVPTKKKLYTASRLRKRLLHRDRLFWSAKHILKKVEISIETFPALNQNIFLNSKKSVNWSETLFLNLLFKEVNKFINSFCFIFISLPHFPNLASARYLHKYLYISYLFQNFLHLTPYSYVLLFSHFRSLLVLFLFTLRPPYFLLFHVVQLFSTFLSAQAINHFPSTYGYSFVLIVPPPPSPAFFCHISYHV